MSATTAIEWTERTWNPTTGCDRVSPGCANCYAMGMAKRLKAMGRPEYQKDGGPASGPGFGVSMHPERLSEPLKWRKPSLVFVDSMSDLFHEEVSNEFLDRAFAVMALTPQHTYQVLTKRPERMRAYFASCRFDVELVRQEYWRSGGDAEATLRAAIETGWPLPNVWLGVSAENQRMWDYRTEYLRQTPAAVRFVSAEPLLSAIDCDLTGIDWVIVGGESGAMSTRGGPERALVERCDCVDTEFPTKDDPACHGTGWVPKESAERWVRSIRDRCESAGVAFLLKQWGGPRPKSGGRVLDGKVWHEFPAHVAWCRNRYFKAQQDPDIDTAEKRLRARRLPPEPEALL